MPLRQSQNTGRARLASLESSPERSVSETTCSGRNWARTMRESGAPGTTELQVQFQEEAVGSELLETGLSPAKPNR